MNWLLLQFHLNLQFIIPNSHSRFNWTFCLTLLSQLAGVTAQAASHSSTMRCPPSRGLWPTCTRYNTLLSLVIALNTRLSLVSPGRAGSPASCTTTQIDSSSWRSTRSVLRWDMWHQKEWNFVTRIDNIILSRIGILIFYNSSILTND